MLKLTKESLIELDARSRATAVLDDGSFRELLGPFDRLESPHLAPQGIVPQSDDGVIVAKGTLSGEPAVIISIEGSFQGGGIGEVSGSKIAGALELALRDNENGIRTRPILLFDTGGVRLQEANYGLLSIAEIGAAIVALREYIPVVGIIPGKIGAFGGMSITAGLCSALIMTQAGRLSLNGPEVIEQEAGIEEFDAADRSLIWNTTGGKQRFETGFVDHLVEDDIQDIREAVEAVFKTGISVSRSSQLNRYHSFLKTIDVSKRLTAVESRNLWKKVMEGSSAHEEIQTNSNDNKIEESRGRTWFKKLTGIENPNTDGVSSVLCTDITQGDERVRYISVVPNSNARFPRARGGEIGLEEGWMIAKYIREAIEEDRGGKPRAIVAIVDVPSQAYGYHEELLGIHQSCAAAVDAYATARLSGHPVIALLVGNAISGAFLSHGMQANRILALNDEGVNVHVMSKRSAARITQRSIAQLEEATKRTPAMAYDIESFVTLGAVHELIEGVKAMDPDDEEIDLVREKVLNAIKDARLGPKDLSHRLQSREARLGGRTASIEVREKLKEQWI